MRSENVASRLTTVRASPPCTRRADWLRLVATSSVPLLLLSPPFPLPLPPPLRHSGHRPPACRLHYWADHCFTPNHWAPHCSDAPLDISIVGLLKVRQGWGRLRSAVWTGPCGAVSRQRCTFMDARRRATLRTSRPLFVVMPSEQGTPHAPDVSRGAHRDYLIERSKYAAAILFAPPGGGAALLADPEPAARMLRTWSMAGLERLFADLFQVHTVAGWRAGPCERARLRVARTTSCAGGWCLGPTSRGASCQARLALTPPHPHCSSYPNFPTPGLAAERRVDMGQAPAARRTG